MKRHVKRSLFGDFTTSSGVRSTIKIILFLAKRILLDGAVVLILGLTKLLGWSFKKVTGNKFSKEGVKDYFEDALDEFDDGE